ncbi:hypothetical protein V5N11_010741 [Cardamine amara subsp. amara]|uniref:CCHC-type domain-containing protein n=1 Tax=Cardamine amara subsp. amara TaxID=228776 RepID=A0ABD1ADU5_CARAN
MGLRVDLRNRCMVQAFCTVDELVETAALLEEGLKEEVVSVKPSLQARSVPHQSVPSRGGRPMQGQKRKRDGALSGSRGGPGCFGCGSTDHRVASCPRKGGVRVDSRVCFHCKEAEHIRPQCPKLRQSEATVVQPVRPVAAAPRVYSIVESGEPSSRPITGIFLDLSKFILCVGEFWLLVGC